MSVSEADRNNNMMVCWYKYALLGTVATLEELLCPLPIYCYKHGPIDKLLVPYLIIISIPKVDEYM